MDDGTPYRLDEVTADESPASIEDSQVDPLSPTPRRRARNVVEVAVILAALATIPLTIAQLRGATGGAVLVADWLVWSIFLVDYLTAVLWAADRRRAARQNWLSLAVVVLSFPALPALLAFTRLARLARVVRLFRLVRFGAVAIRGLHGLRRALGHRGLIYLVLVTILLVFAGGILVSFLEPSLAEGGFWSGVWWASSRLPPWGTETSPPPPWGDV